MSDEQPEKEAEVKTGELPKINAKHALFVDNYFLLHFNATAAYKVVYPTSSDHAARANAARLIATDNIQAHVKARFAELNMGTDEGLLLLTQQARGSIGGLFKPVDEWMFYPLPTYEILDAKEVEDDSTDPPKKRIMYRVRHLVLDIDKLIDPAYAHLVKRFQDKGKDGMSIELHDPQAAIDKILKVQGAYKNNVALSNPDGSALAGTKVYIGISPDDWDKMQKAKDGD